MGSPHWYAQPPVVYEGFKMTTEKRAWERFNTKVSLRVLGTDVVGVTRDFGPSGLSFTSKTEFPSGTRLQLELDLPYAAPVPSIICEVQIVWCEAVGASFTIGARVLGDPLPSTLLKPS